MDHISLKKCQERNIFRFQFQRNPLFFKAVPQTPGVTIAGPPDFTIASTIDLPLTGTGQTGISTGQRMSTTMGGGTGMEGMKYTYNCYQQSSRVNALLSMRIDLTT